jgi:molybdopterin synthase sulfur carrier subunit
MKISVRYMAQLRSLLGCGEQSITLPAGSSVQGLLAHLAAEKTEVAPHLVTPSGEMRPSLLVAINGSAVASQQAALTSLADGDIVTLLPPIAGG